jgi:hypothetical protein
MEFHEIDDVDSYKLFKHSVEFLYEKNLKKFIGNFYPVFKLVR